MAYVFLRCVDRHIDEVEDIQTEAGHVCRLAVALSAEAHLVNQPLKNSPPRGLSDLETLF